MERKEFGLWASGQMLPKNVSIALEREIQTVNKLNSFLVDISAMDLSSQERHRLMVPVIESKLSHARLAEQMLTEYDYPHIYPIVREQLKDSFKPLIRYF